MLSFFFFSIFVPIHTLIMLLCVLVIFLGKGQSQQTVLGLESCGQAYQGLAACLL